MRGEEETRWEEKRKRRLASRTREKRKRRAHECDPVFGGRDQKPPPLRKRGRGEKRSSTVMRSVPGADRWGRRKAVSRRAGKSPRGLQREEGEPACSGYRRKATSEAESLGKIARPKILERKKGTATRPRRKASPLAGGMEKRAGGQEGGKSACRRRINRRVAASRRKGYCLGHNFFGRGGNGL